MSDRFPTRVIRQTTPGASAEAETPLRAAVVGAGYMGRFDARKYDSLAAACDRRLQRGHGHGG